MKVLFYGGSFDPVHDGHLSLARSASKFLGGQVVTFLPSRSARWKHPESKEEDRLGLLEEVLKRHADFPYEIDRFLFLNPQFPDYTYDFLRDFKDKNPEAEVYFLLGGDSVLTFPRWKKAEELPKLAKFLYLPREGVEIDPKIFDDFGIKAIQGESPGPSSSTAIRELEIAHPYLEARAYIGKREMYYCKTIREYLGEHRYLHSLRVAELAASFFQSGSQKEGEAYIAGILHDLAKDLPIERQTELAKRYGSLEGLPKWAYHQYAGAVLAKELFPKAPESSIKAIASHCTGSGDMDEIAKAIYAADKTEPGRGYDSSKMIESCHQDLEDGFRYVLRENKAFLEGKGYTITDPYSESCYKRYL